jgi:hypothetical protein
VYSQVSGSWWDTIKVVWRYGLMSPKKTQSLQVLPLLDLYSLLNEQHSVQEMIKQFVTLYSPETAKWDDISDLASSFGWANMVAQTTLQYLVTDGVSEKYAHEFVEATTRVNYGQVRFICVLSIKWNGIDNLGRMSTRFTHWRVRAQWPLTEPRASKEAITKFSSSF